MKIGIFTFHRAKNYGAVLQCYALYSFLKRINNDVRVIDYAPTYLAGMKDNASVVKRMVAICKSIIYWFINLGETKIGDVFSDFIENYLTLASLDDAKNMDAIVCGSDQIWNPNICNGFDPIFFGKIPLSKDIYAISYAASMGNTDILPLQIKEFTTLINYMNAVSVRESSLSKLLNSIGIKNKLVVDPVLLAGEECFRKIIIPIRQKKPFVLVYELTQLQHTYTMANNIASQIGAEVVVIGGGFKGYFKKDIKNKQWLSPSQFVSYLYNASCIVTNSFHGLAFSLIFEKQFYVLKTNSWKDDRLVSLLSQINLTNRIVSNDTRIKYTSIDYSQPNLKLNELRSESSNYLLRTITSKI